MVSFDSNDGSEAPDERLASQPTTNAIDIQDKEEASDPHRSTSYYYDIPYLHGLRTGLLDADTDAYLAFIGHQETSKQHWNELLQARARWEEAQRARKETERKREELENKIAQNRADLAKIQTQQQQLAQPEHPRRTMLAVAQQRLANLQAEAAYYREQVERFRGRHNWGLTIVYLIAAVILISGEYMVMMQLVATSGIVESGDFEKWAFPLTIVMFSVMLKPAFDYFSYRSRPRVKWHSIFYAISIVLFIATAFCLSYYRMEQNQADVDNPQSVDKTLIVLLYFLMSIIFAIGGSILLSKAVRGLHELVKKRAYEKALRKNEDITQAEALGVVEQHLAALADAEASWAHNFTQLTELNKVAVEQLSRLRSQADLEADAEDKRKATIAAHERYVNTCAENDRRVFDHATSIGVRVKEEVKEGLLRKARGVALDELTERTITRYRQLMYHLAGRAVPPAPNPGGWGWNRTADPDGVNVILRNGSGNQRGIAARHRRSAERPHELLRLATVEQHLDPDLDNA